MKVLVRGRGAGKGVATERAASWNSGLGAPQGGCRGNAAERGWREEAGGKPNVKGA